MKKLIKSYPTTIISLLFLSLMIPVSIILYFALGPDKEHELTVNYGFPVISMIIIMVLFELTFRKRKAK